MFERNFLFLQLPSTVGAGLIAGTFFCFSSFVMPALAKLEPAHAVSAMQKINISVINPLFMTVLFGTAFLYLAQLFVIYKFGGGAAGPLWVAAAGLYVLGAIGTTLFCNVPLNDQLALVPPDTATPEIWANFVARWTLWNTLRGLAATLATATSLVAIALAR